MKNKLRLYLNFDFKGKTQQLSCELDLDAYLEKKQSLPCLYEYLAEKNNISPYHYEHDVMMVSDLQCECLEGFAAEYIDEYGHFDSDGFCQAWRQEKATEVLAAIALEHLNIESLAAHPEQKKALYAAYEYGKKEQQQVLINTISGDSRP